MKKGFTLVELSIVLVIIGLLIGGILVGQSLIESSKINSQIRELQQIQIAYDLFKERYRCVPGDCTIGLGTTAGDGDNTLGCQHERANFWFHLDAAQILTQDTLSGTFTSCSSNYTVLDGNNSYSSLHGDDSSYVAAYARVRGLERRNGLILANRVPTRPINNVGNSFLDPKFVLSVDQKIDDGIPLEGDLQGAEANDNLASTTDCTSTSSFSNSAAPANTTYSIDNEGERCVLIYFLEK